MSRNRFLVPVLAAACLSMGIAVVNGRSVAASAPAQNLASTDPYYCPPGSKFCPVPGSDNSVVIDTHFGMDAKTGEVVRYTGNVHPDETFNSQPAKEVVLYTSPPISVENRYVPNPGGNQAAPVAVRQGGTYYPPAVTPPSSTPVGPETASEVAYVQTENRQPDRAPTRGKKPWWKFGLGGGEKEQPTEGEKIPWYKGGMWRNKKDPAPDNAGSGSSGSGSGPAALSAADDMWGDEQDYDGYNPDGTFGRPAGSAIAGNQPPVQYGDPYAANDPYSFNDPYAQPQFAPAPVAQGGPAYVGDPYTMPNSPPPSSPYQDGYTYPGTDLTYQPGPQTGYIASAPVSSPDSSPSFFASPSDNAFLPPPPAAAQGAPAAAAIAGTPQFENAVRMVKENRFTEAKAILSMETSSNPNSAPAWRWLADCHYNLLELEDAINAYERARQLDPNDYYALRGQGFAYLHRGHELWRRMQQEVQRGQKEQAAATFAQAHENYRKSIELIGLCLRRAPNDGEAIYGEAMAAEGASRKLYSNAVSFLKLGPENRERAEIFAENCLTVINKGIQRASQRAKDAPGESGPRALLGGLFLRKAMLYRQLGKNELALMELKNSYDVQQSILDEIDKNNANALKGVQECKNYWTAWGGEGNV